MTPAEIRFALDVAGTNQREIARRLMVTDGMISMVITGTRPTPRVRRAISTAIGRSYEDVWGVPDPGLTAGEELHKPAPAPPMPTSSRVSGRRAGRLSRQEAS